MSLRSKSMPVQTYCIHCQKLTGYRLKGTSKKEWINNKEFDFILTKAYCRNCGREIPVTGIGMINREERDEQYRKAEGLISMDSVRKLVNLYGVNTKDLSVALGFTEQTIKRYLDGQMPTKKDSDIMIKALTDSNFFFGTDVQEKMSK